jgi:hypothetical protein
LWLIVLKIGVALALFWFMSHTIKQALTPLTTPRAPAMQSPALLPEPAGPPPNVMAQPVQSAPPPTYAEQPAYQPPTPEDVRESKRRADEAMKVIEATTPEM